MDGYLGDSPLGYKDTPWCTLIYPPPPRTHNQPTSPALWQQMGEGPEEGGVPFERPLTVHGEEVKTGCSESVV